MSRFDYLKMRIVLTILIIYLFAYVNSNELCHLFNKSLIGENNCERTIRFIKSYQNTDFYYNCYYRNKYCKIQLCIKNAICPKTISANCGNRNNIKLILKSSEHLEYCNKNKNKKINKNNKQHIIDVSIEI
ncbi:hypothetical protein Catovirus_1_411 [Catovirus CTV1]|uniref:Uncharacterized protein n=1 Tax=Catovirus CTV1 TaxID=1977631 RepID=A0A1V0S9I9_9VIRU|nr:hypothetical protein Catovirus_1_411 [Catovirus CTV1]